ncbi:hypothetical protein Nmar_1461 [Nitrosopumilus maritimus SCM1]|uniref:Uncharacterized protein n=2 Tax=Nitrosopumilus maritimus TaxID=338192 RepID=A9A3U5_NITMS|nr:hypothetical protein Nmar_1461 [Nitrosopumilus maritimus SCM1]
MIHCQELFETAHLQRMHIQVFQEKYLPELVYCSEKGFLSSDEIQYIDHYHDFLEFTCDDLKTIKPAFTSEIQQYGYSIALDRCTDVDVIQNNYGSFPLDIIENTQVEPEPECKPEPRPENEGGLWMFDYEKCEWNKKQWWMSDQLEKIIQDCLDPENKIGDKGMSNGTTKLKTTTCTWQHGGFYNQVYVEEWADPVPLIQDNKIIGPDGQIFKILED